MSGSYQHWTQHNSALLWSFGWTTLFCIAIAVLLWVLRLSEPFSMSLGISLCIGWSILGVHVIAGPRLERQIGLTLTNVVATAAGLLFALGALALFFRTSGISLGGIDWTTAAPALFFGAIGTIVFTTMARLHQAREDLSNAELERLAAERALAEAQLKTLQAQIEPHFLFNTLSTAVGLIHSHPTAAEETLQQLTTLLRNSLSRTRTAQTTLAEEFALVAAYLRIGQIRMGDRLQFSIEIEDDLNAIELPPMLVQPLVENAVTHGLEPSERGGKLTVRVAQTEDAANFEIVITDTGLGLSNNNKSAGTNTGLRNVRDRLQALYGDNASLRLKPNTPSGVIATLTLPITTPASQTAPGLINE